MAVAKFNWHGTNPNKAFRYQKPPMSAWGEMVYFNATKAENEAAYNALVNHGPVSDFKTKVWNDICAKVYDLCDEWQINDVYRKSAVWSPFIHEPDRAAWEALAKSKWPDWDEYQVEEWVDNMWRTWKPGTFTAWDYNVLYGQWLLPVGLQKFEVQRGQRLKGEYILRLVEIINHWTELSPLTVKFSTSYKWGKKGKSAVLPSASIDPDYLEMHFMLRDGTRVDDSIQIHIKLDLNLLIEKMTIAELISCPIKSLINFMKLNVKCKIWDKFPIYLNIELGMEHDGTASPVMLSPVHLSALWTGIFQTIATVYTAFVLDGFRVFLSGTMSDHVLPGMADAYGFSFSTNHGQHRGMARIRTRRPLPFSALSRHYWGGKVLVEHQGTLLLFMEDGGISFADNTSLSDDSVFHAEHTGRIGIKRTITDATVLSAVSMTAEEDEIVYHGKEIEGRVAGVVDVAHRERFKTESSQSIQKTPADPIAFDGEVQGMRGGAEMSFANEQTFVMRDGTIGVKEDDIQIAFQETAALDISDTYDTEETIALEDAPPFEIGEADIVIRSDYTAMLERDRTIEAAADAIIQSLQSGEVSFGLNANLEADLIAGKITAAAVLEANRRSALESEVDVSTIESAIAACVLRKLMESSISVETQIKASMILSLIRFAESTDNIVRVSAESDAIARVPKKLQSKTQYITSQTDAFMDASYMRGNGLLADAKIRIETDVMPEAVNSGTYLASLAIAEIICETTLGREPTAALEGNAVASAGSEAGVVLARSILILASTVEDNLVSEEEMILAADFERTLTID